MSCHHLASLALPLLIATVACAAEPVQVELYKRGDNGVSSYRIPSLIATPKGTLLAFAEARQSSGADHGHIQTVLRRSTDGGQTWSSIQIVARDGAHAVQNPTAVIDGSTGVVWLMLVRTDTKRLKTGRDIETSRRPVRRMWVTSSKDDGITWAKPRDITRSVCLANWKECVAGPGVGIQLRGGRLVIPSYYCEIGGKDYADYIVYSDDHGKNWHRGGGPGAPMDECQAVELSDGSLMLNMRSNRRVGHRAISISKDQGLTWSPIVDDPTLVEPICQASILRYPSRDVRTRLLFSNPAREKVDDRTHMTVRLSYDEGKSWPVKRLLNAGRSSYSCLAVLPDGTIGCLYERGQKSSSDQITFARFPLEWLESPGE